jgi:hypothetical protein
MSMHARVGPVPFSPGKKGKKGKNLQHLQNRTHAVAAGNKNKQFKKKKSRGGKPQ